MKKVAILYSKYTPTIDAIIYILKDIACVDLFAENDIKKLESYELIIALGIDDNKLYKNTINIHHSLLPAFNTENPVKDAIVNGAKVTGLTIYYTNPFKIIAQYPIFIHNNTHYDELVQELEYLEQVIYPLVIEKILKNEIFEIEQLLSIRNKCGGSCEGCGKCKN